MPSERAPAGLVGRDSDWRTARGVLARVAEGVGAVLLVAGEAGIGKTAFSEELYRVARRESWQTAWATCASGATLPGLWPWQRILSALEHGDAPVSVEAGDPVAARVVLFDLIADRLAHASDVAPVLVVIDDAHWADPASAAMLLHVAATVRQGTGLRARDLPPRGCPSRPGAHRATAVTCVPAEFIRAGRLRRYGGLDVSRLAEVDCHARPREVASLLEQLLDHHRPDHSADPAPTIGQ